MKKDYGDPLNNAISNFDEFTHTILKGHLVVDEKVNELIRAVCKKPEALDLRRMRFHEKVALLEAILGTQKHNIWVALARFNAIRNEIAHSLTSPEKAQLVADFVSALSLKTKGMGALCETDDYRIEVCFFGMVMLLDWIDKTREQAANQASEVTARKLAEPQR
jgi:hypothetical protein